MRRHQRRGRGFQFKGLKRYESGGIEYVYHRKSGIQLPSDIPESHPDFLKAYLDAENQGQSSKTPARAGTIEGVMHKCTLSPEFRSLSQSYQDLICREFKKICKKGGETPFTQIRTRHIENDIKDLDTNASNKRLKAWRMVCKFAKGRIRDDDPSEGIKAKPEPKTTGHKPWVDADVEIFRKHWGYDTRERLAFELIHWTGARMSDAVRLGPGMIDKDGWLNFTQKKTGGDVSIPFHRTPPDIADPSDLAHLMKAIAAHPRQMTFMVTSFDSSRSEKSASQWFSKAAREAGIKGKTAHGLRKTRAITIAERGGSTHQIAAWTGHESLSEVESYSKAAQKKRILSGVESEQKLSKVRDL